MEIAVDELDAKSACAAIPDLAAVLADCVAGGASMGFLDGFGIAEAAQYFQGVFEDAGRGKLVLLAARQGRRIVGTVQLGLDTMPNQPHRADVRKLLVHRAARNAGVGERLMRDIETFARRHGRSLLVLDTVTDSAGYRLYERLGWQRVGVIPDYALWPDGRFCDTTVFYRRIAP
jgi:ribosomal protein S18 acetylase RimI-like enzyme